MSKFEGTVEDIVFRNVQNGWTVASVRLEGSGRIAAVGVMPFLSVGERAVFDGEKVEHRDYGTQIRVASYESFRPETRSAVEKYLASGLVRGIGPATAKRIVEHFGAKALDVLETTPERLTEIDGIGKKRMAMIAESFALQNEMRSTLIFMQKYGFSSSLSVKIYRAYGKMTEQILRTNPYRLVDEIEGVGFKTADAIATEMGFGRESRFRLRSGILYVLNEAVNGLGHMYLPEGMLLEQACRMLEVDADRVEHVMKELLIRGELIGENIQGERVVYLPRGYEAERETAQRLIHLQQTVVPERVSESRLLRQIAAYEREEGVALCDRQREAVLAALQEGVVVITGGPGTGKTTSIKCIIRLMEQLVGKVELCAPTGRAAKRMSEATGCEARTLHRLLEYCGDGTGFVRNETNPLEADGVIVDEMSMVDIFLMRSLLRALRRQTRLVLVGDADQLLSVGAGNVLRDLIDSGAVRVVRLSEIFRQAEKSMIVVNAHRINRGELPEIRTRDTDFFLERKENVRDAAAAVVELVRRRLPEYLKADGLKAIQVMAPMKRGELGVFALNGLLRDALNPFDPEKPQILRGDSVFRLGDKVMQIKNNYDLEWSVYGRNGAGVFNGDIGYIVDIDVRDAALTVEFDDGRRAVYDAAGLDELEPAYCMSVHKSQGSEFEAVVLPLVGGAPMLMTRNLLYTAVTRAKRLVIIVGREQCIRAMVENNRVDQRYSALALRLRKVCDGE
ncbi:MAG: ATP-dependent RecD-like DNA helicase [Christensenellales bacterium]|nr:ATP-dependent RecD-like DNA helicase [Christensenellales bacterium]